MSNATWFNQYTSGYWFVKNVSKKEFTAKNILTKWLKQATINKIKTGNKKMTLELLQKHIRGHCASPLSSKPRIRLSENTSSFSRCPAKNGYMQIFLDEKKRQIGIKMCEKSDSGARYVKRSTFTTPSHLKSWVPATFELLKIADGMEIYAEI